LQQGPLFIWSIKFAKYELPAKPFINKRLNRDLTGKVRTSHLNFGCMNIVITGASKGIGKAVTERFADDKQGHTFFLCSRDNKTLKILEKDLQGRFPRTNIYTRACDLSKREEINKFAEWILHQAEKVDILVNNAGVFTPGNIYDEEDGLLETTLEVNLFAPYHLTRLLLPGMIRQKSGHIFNISSIAGLQAYPGGGSYSISKFALDGFSKNLRHEMKPHGIKVTTVYPGATYTDSWKSTGIAADRFMKVDDIAKMIYAASQLSPQACVEDIVIRPQLGDL
jgi:short-subunit dehydrogenase